MPVDGGAVQSKHHVMVIFDYKMLSGWPLTSDHPPSNPPLSLDPSRLLPFELYEGAVCWGACALRKVFVEGNFIKSVNLKFFIGYDNKCVGFNKLKPTSLQTVLFFYCFLYPPVQE